MSESSQQPAQPPTPESNARQPVQQPSVRQMLIGGVGFLLFLTALTVLINAVGVENIQAAIREAGIFAPLVYIAIKAATYVFAPLTSGPIQVVAGTLFDSVLLGVLYTLAGEVLGGCISFWLARRFGQPMVRRLVGDENLERVNNVYKHQLGGWVSLAVARIVLFSLWDFLSYAAGLAESIRFRTYALVSAVFGFFPTFFFVWVGNRAVLDTTSLLLVYGLVALLILLPLLFRRQITRLLQFTSNKTGDTASRQEHQR